MIVYTNFRKRAGRYKRDTKTHKTKRNGQSHGKKRKTIKTQTNVYRTQTTVYKTLHRKLKTKLHEPKMKFMSWYFKKNISRVWFQATGIAKL